MTTVDILEELNEDQKGPVMDYHGPSFIVAGPGSGKTKTVVSRTAYMIVNGVDPSSILLFTFTNKAAKELQSRISKKIGPSAKQITVGTYHSVCNRILRKYSDTMGFNKNFTIFDSEDSTKLLKRVVKGTNVEPKFLAEYISLKKRNLLSPSVVLQNASADNDQQLASFYEKYQQELYRQDAMDFDDLIYYTIKLLEYNPDILSAINAQYHYITADEYHDSSRSDIRLIELLGGDRKNICFILDDEQSIYAFRGADIKAVLGVQDVMQVKKFILRQNYRSTKMIVAAARSLIGKNKNQIEKEIFTDNKEGAPVVFFDEQSSESEALRVRKIVMLITQKHGLDYRDIAVLYRMSYLSRSVESELLAGGIPYEIVGGISFMSRQEIKDIMSFIKLVMNPNDFQALDRVVNLSKNGVGEKSVASILLHARENETDLVTACRQVEFKGKAKASMEQFNLVMEDLFNSYETDTPFEFLKRIINSTNYYSIIRKSEESASKAEERISNIIELMELAQTFDTIADFFENTSLHVDVDHSEEDGDNYVKLMTMHSSKGLEYKAIIIIGTMEGVIPHWRAETQLELEEERRLFYVAMTRAEQYLFITRPRHVRQQGRYTPTSESRFIKEIDKNYLKKYSGK